MGESSREKLDMYHHGTLRWSPTPRVVYDTAVNDLRNYRRRFALKQAKESARAAGASAKYQGNAKGVAFLPAHLSSAITASDVIKAAIKGIQDGRKSRSVETLYIYSSIETLRASLEIAEAAERSDRETPTEARQTS